MIDERMTAIATVTITDHAGTKTARLCDRCDHPIWNPDGARQVKDGRYYHRHWTDCIGYLRTNNAALKEQLASLSGGGPMRNFTLVLRDPVAGESIERRYLAWPIGEQDSDDIPFIAAPAPQEEH